MSPQHLACCCAPSLPPCSSSSCRAARGACGTRCPRSPSVRCGRCGRWRQRSSRAGHPRQASCQQLCFAVERAGCWCIVQVAAVKGGTKQPSAFVVHLAVLWAAGRLGPVVSVPAPDHHGAGGGARCRARAAAVPHLRPQRLGCAPAPCCCRCRCSARVLCLSSNSVPDVFLTIPSSSLSQRRLDWTSPPMSSSSRQVLGLPGRVGAQGAASQTVCTMLLAAALSLTLVAALCT